MRGDLREAPEAVLETAGGKREIIIVSTALMDWGHAGAEPGVPAVVSAFGLDTQEKKVEFLDR